MAITGNITMTTTPPTAAPNSGGDDEVIGNAARKRGARLARFVFQRLGNHTEAHLGEAELAALLAFAYELGVKDGLAGLSG